VPIVLTPPKVHTTGATDLTFERQVQVILYNDEVHSFDEVLGDVMNVFGHTLPIATKIIAEAHSKGKAIAEVEDREKAQLHKDLLQSCTPPYTIEIEEV